MSTTDFLAPQAAKTADHSRESSFVMFHVPDGDKPKAATSALTSDELNALTSTTGSADKSTPEGKPALELQNFPSSPTTSFTQLTSPTSEKGDDVKFTQASSTLELEGYPDTPKNCYERKTGCNRALYWSNCCIIAGIILWVIPLFLPAVVSVLMQQQICDKLCVPIPQVLNANGTWVENLNVNNTEDWKLNNFLTNSNRSWWPVEYFNVYLYNITNSAAVIAGNETNLKVKLVGPYVFSTYREKYNASFSPDFEIIYYNQLASYTFLPNLSYPRLLTDTLTVISMPLVSINWMQWEYAKTPYNFLFATLCKNDQRSCLFQTLPASQIIFSSTSTIYNTALGLLKPLAPTFQLFFNYSTNPTVANQQHLVNSFGMGGELHPYIGSFYTFPPPAGLPVAVKFNMTMGRPTTNDSLLNAQYTGQGSSYSNLFGFTQFEGNTSINTWNGPEYISGTDHFQFAPPVTPDSLISVWDDDVMRVVDLQFQEKVSVLGSYDAYRFTPTDDLFSGTDPHYFGAAGYEGLLDVSPVSQIHYGSLVTAYASRPFLAGVNSTLASTVNCTNCPDMSNPDDWLDVFVDIEPNTGKVLGGSKRGQINALIGQPPIYNNNYSLPKIEVSTLYKNIPMSLVPLVYFEYTSLIEWGPQTDQLDDGLNQVKLARIATATLFYLFLSLSSIAFLSSFVIALEADKNGACCTSKPKRPYTGTKTD